MSYLDWVVGQFALFVNHLQLCLDSVWCCDADVAAQSKKKGRKAMDEAMHVVKQSMSDTGGLGYFHVRNSSSSLHTVCLRPCDSMVMLAVSNWQYRRFQLLPSVLFLPFLHTVCPWLHAFMIVLAVSEWHLKPFWLLACALCFFMSMMMCLCDSAGSEWCRQGYMLVVSGAIPSCANQLSFSS